MKHYGISQKQFYRSLEWKEAAVKARKRDNNCCRMCGANYSVMSVHHVVSVKDIRRESDTSSNTDLDNLVTLCIWCHRDLHLNRRKWTR
jgi:5-methylcytosine-specific restriction endonuclease McrA